MKTKNVSMILLILAFLVTPVLALSNITRGCDYTITKAYLYDDGKDWGAYVKGSKTAEARTVYIARERASAKIIDIAEDQWAINSNNTTDSGALMIEGVMTLTVSGKAGCSATRTFTKPD